MLKLLYLPVTCPDQRQQISTCLFDESKQDVLCGTLVVGQLSPSCALLGAHSDAHYVSNSRSSYY